MFYPIRVSLVWSSMLFVFCKFTLTTFFSRVPSWYRSCSTSYFCVTSTLIVFYSGSEKLSSASPSVERLLRQKSTQVRSVFVLLFFTTISSEKATRHRHNQLVLLLKLRPQPLTDVHSSERLGPHLFWEHVPFPLCCCQCYVPCCIWFSPDS